MNNKKCADLIAGELKSLERDAQEWVKDFYSGDESGIENWNNVPLEISTHSLTRILLSYGGPMDFLNVEHDGGVIVNITYHYQNWFDGASLPVEKSSPVWRYCETVIDTLAVR